MYIKNNKNCKITINDEKIGKYTIKTADEMFEALGYEKIRDDERFIKYRKLHDNESITIDKKTKDFIKSFYSVYWKAINMEELQAINKKVLELGWLKKES